MLKFKKLNFGRDSGAAKPSEKKTKYSARLIAFTAFLSGLLIALCLCWMGESYLMAKSAEARLVFAGNIANRPASFANVRAGEGFKELASLNPFGAATPLRQEDIAQTETLPISSLSLVGTHPNVAAWVRDGSATELYLIGQDVRGYELTNVEYGKITLSKEGKDYPLYLLFSGGTTASTPAKQPTVNTSSGRPRGNASKDQSRFEGIIAAGDGQEGVVPRELVDALLMNPYDEMGKMRMVPAEGGGVQLQQIQPDSVLAHVGVAQGDVIKAINGIEISNLGDMANAVNSLMSGARFDVTVERKGNPVDLNYQVN
ncbi:PDZ domain-containing protein [Synergistaceae bacterium OttesenSCG-928-D05]|nr:PDZ domain-containing protein [Synergistaceae bacterium OttesenSCG-928-D05]